MSKRHAREHGRVLSVDEETLGSVLVADAASGATTLYVDDAAEFEDDGTGGWLSVNDQVIEYDTVDDDAGTIHLKTALTAAADDGDPVYVWSKLYDTAATVKTALVMVDGEDENTDPIHAVLADAVQDLPEGLRGGTDGESCTLHRVSDDEWEVTAVGGRPTQAKGVKFTEETFTVAGAGAQAFTLSHVPRDHSEHLYWRPAGQGGVYLGPAYFSRSDRTISIPDTGAWAAGDKFTVEYAHDKDLSRPNTFNALNDVPITLPAGASAGDAVMVAVVFNTGGAYQLNGFTLIGETAAIDHLVSNGFDQPNQTKLLVMSGALGPQLTVPTFTPDSTDRDMPYVVAAFPRGGSIGPAAVGTVTDGGSGTTPAVTAGQTLRVWAVMGDNQHITVPSSVSTMVESNPPRNTSQANNIEIVLTMDNDDGGARTATCSTTAGWMLAAIHAEVNL